MAKRTQIISDINPQLNRETALTRDLFVTKTNSMDLLNQTLSDALPLDVATIKAESCLYRIERDIGAYFRTETSAMVAAPGKKIKRTKKKDGDTDMVDRGF